MKGFKYIFCALFLTALLICLAACSRGNEQSAEADNTVQPTPSAAQPQATKAPAAEPTAAEPSDGLSDALIPEGCSVSDEYYKIKYYTKHFVYDGGRNTSKKDTVRVKGVHVRPGDPSEEEMAVLMPQLVMDKYDCPSLPNNKTHGVYEAYYSSEAGKCCLRKYEGDTVLWDKPVDWNIRDAVEYGDYVIVKAELDPDSYSYSGLIVFNSEGEMLWNKTAYETDAGTYREIKSIIPEPDDTIAVFGRCNTNNVFFRRYSITGELLAEQESETGKMFYFKSAVRYKDGYALICNNPMSYLTRNEYDIVYADHEGVVRAATVLSMEAIHSASHPPWSITGFCMFPHALSRAAKGRSCNPWQHPLFKKTPMAHTFMRLFLLKTWLIRSGSITAPR